MRAMVLALLAATPVAAGATFLALPAPASEGFACGDDACFRLAPDEVTIRLVGGGAYAFLATDGTVLEGATLCAPALVDIPPGAAFLHVDLAECAR